MYLTWAHVCRLEDVLDDSCDNKLVLSITMYYLQIQCSMPLMYAFVEIHYIECHNVIVLLLF